MAGSLRIISLCSVAMVVWQLSAARIRASTNIPLHEFATNASHEASMKLRAPVSASSVSSASGGAADDSLIVGPQVDRFEQVCMAGARRAIFQDYAAFHRRCRTDSACLSQALIWQCDDDNHCGGIGDEIRGLVFTFYTAMTLQRPFFVRWRRMGQDMLNLFEKQEIDVQVPPGLQACPTIVAMDLDMVDTGVIELFDMARASTGCDTWRTTVNPMRGHGRAAQVMPVMREMPLEYVIGCAMDYMFKALVLSPAERVNFAGLPRRFSAIHLRCLDHDMETQPHRGSGTRDDFLEVEVEAALQCHAKMQAEKSVVFVSCSEPAKELAVQLGKRMGLHVITSQAQARHVDKDWGKLSAEALRQGMWSDFVVLQHAESIVRCGFSLGAQYGFSHQLFFDHGSGFSGAAASMGLIPAEQMFRLTHNESICAPDWIMAKGPPRE